MTDPSDEDPPGSISGHIRRSGSWRDALVVVVLALTILGAVLIVRALASGEPSAETNHPSVLPTPVIAVDRACANFADFWSGDSGVTVPAASIQAIGSCWQAADGSWFIPTGPNDRRLPAGTKMTDAERAQTAALRQTLLLQLTELERMEPSGLKRDLGKIYDPRTRPVTGHIRDGYGIGQIRGRYTRLAQAFLLGPEYQALADYVGWRMERKIEANEVFIDTCAKAASTEYLVGACGGLGDSLSVRFPPFVWDLRDPLTLETYLAEIARSSPATPIAGTPVGSPTG